MIERRCGCICSIDSASAGSIDNRIKPSRGSTSRRDFKMSCILKQNLQQQSSISQPHHPSTQSHTPRPHLLDSTSPNPPPLHLPPPHPRNSSINPSWNARILPTHSVPGAKNVVRKCNVPSLCPKPDPGTTQTPVASRRRKQ